MRFLILTLAVCAVANAQDERKAIVRVQGPIVNGNVTFTQLEENGPVRVQGTVLGLTTGRYGFHVHEKGDLTGGCLSSGGHFNPHKQDHGAPQDHVRHVGDLGNIESRDGVARIDLEDHLLSLSGEHNIIGRALVIHSAEDDLGRTSHPDSKKTGNAGSRVSCGVIGILKMPNSGIELKPSSIVMVSAILLAIAQIL